MPGYPCCCTPLVTCGGYCPGGAPAQLQLTVPTDAYANSGSPDEECSDGDCDERSGVFLLDLSDSSQWYSANGSYDEGACVYKSADFTVCYGYIAGGPGDPPWVLVEKLVRWQVHILPSDVGFIYAYLCEVNGSGFPTGIDFDRWEILWTGSDCGDPLTLTDSADGITFGGGCTVNAASELTLELPP